MTIRATHILFTFIVFIACTQPECLLPEIFRLGSGASVPPKAKDPREASSKTKHSFLVRIANAIRVNDDEDKHDSHMYQNSRVETDIADAVHPSPNLSDADAGEDVHSVAAMRFGANHTFPGDKLNVLEGNSRIGADVTESNPSDSLSLIHI